MAFGAFWFSTQSTIAPSMSKLSSVAGPPPQWPIPGTRNDYLFGLFSKSLDVALDELAGADPVRLPQSRWDLRFDTSTRDLNATTHEVTVTSAVQAIPPENPTLEERNTTYELLMPEGRELQTQIVNGHVKLRLRHPRTQAIVVEKDFRLGDVKPGKPRATGQFIHDRKVGAWKTYYSNGRIESAGAYPDKPYNDEPTGARVPAGATMTHNYADKGLYYDWGPRIGPWTFWNPDGTEVRR
jgi:hypothetical protein